MISNYKFTENAFLPKSVIIPLIQEKDVLCKPLVKIGDDVVEGQIIAESSDAVIHSPVPGSVVDINFIHCPYGKIEKAIKIKTKGSFTYLGKKLNSENWISLSPASLERKLKDKGIINTFSCTQSVSLLKQIKKISKNNTKTIIVRLFDEDTTRFADKLETKFYIKSIMEGADILAKIISADGIIYVIDQNSEVTKDFENDDKHNIYFMKMNADKYTNGYKKEIVDNFIKYHKKNCKLSITRNDLFIDSYTLMDIYNAVINDIPVMTKNVLFTGNCIPASCFLNVRIGFTLREIVNQIGGFIKNPGTIIINGKLCGHANNNLDIPITKYVKSVEFISKANTTDSQVYSCVKCGSCRFNCPVKIAPDILYDYVLKKTDIPQAYLKTATLCTNCGICNTVCQARIPLCQVITMIKNKMDKENEK